MAFSSPHNPPWPGMMQYQSTFDVKNTDKERRGKSCEQQCLAQTLSLGACRSGESACSLPGGRRRKPPPQTHLSLITSEPHQAPAGRDGRKLCWANLRPPPGLQTLHLQILRVSLGTPESVRFRIQSPHLREQSWVMGGSTQAGGLASPFLWGYPPGLPFVISQPPLAADCFSCVDFFPYHTSYYSEQVTNMHAPYPQILFLVSSWELPPDTKMAVIEVTCQTLLQRVPFYHRGQRPWAASEAYIWRPEQLEEPFGWARQRRRLQIQWEVTG